MESAMKELNADLRVAFVTGGTGLLGSNLVRLLVSKGMTVRVLARSEKKARRQFEGCNVEIVQGDMQNVEGFQDSLRGVDAVFHTAAYFRDNYKGGSHWQELHRTNVIGTSALLEAAYANGVRKFVHASSIAVIDAPKGVVVTETMPRSKEDTDDYQLSKILSDEEVEKFLKTHDEFFANFVLPGWMHGPGDLGPTSAGQMVLDFLHAKLPGLAPAGFSLVDARDVAAAMLAAAIKGKRGEKYIASGRYLTMGDLCHFLEQISGVKSPKLTLPLPLLYAIATANEAWSRISGQQTLISLASVSLMDRAEKRSQVFDTSKFEKELGLSFRPVEETLKDEIDWFVSQGNWKWEKIAPSPCMSFLCAGRK